MNKKNNLPDAGDVIMSPKFAFGYYETDRKIIYIDGVTKKYMLESNISEKDRVAMAAKSGKIPPKVRVEDYGAYDESRAQAKFVVENAAMEGGERGRDYYPDGWRIVARRLKGDGTYDPKGEVISFYMSGSFSCKLEPGDVQIVEKKQMQVQFI